MLVSEYYVHSQNRGFSPRPLSPSGTDSDFRISSNRPVLNNWTVSDPPPMHFPSTKTLGTYQGMLCHDKLVAQS